MRSYSTVQGDTWDAIAHKLYGDATCMTLLLNANPDRAKTVIFSDGVRLLVLDKPTDLSASLPPWRRED